MPKNNRAADLRRYFGLLQEPILVRDSRSQATLHRAGVDSELMPDTVFSLPPLRRTPPPKRVRPQVGFAVTECRGSEKTTYANMLRSLRDSGIDPVLVTTCIPEDGEFLQRLAEETELPFVSNRLHGVIFAFLGHTPVIPMTNRDKVAGVRADAELNRHVERLEQITPSAIRQWIEQSNEIVAEMTPYASAARDSWDSHSMSGKAHAHRLVA